MDFGMPTLVELNTIEENAELCNKLGLQFVELNMNLPICQIEALSNVDYLENIMNKYNVYFTIHLDENINVADFNSLLANAHIQTTLKTIELAKKLNIKSLTMHMNKGVYFSLPNGKFYLFNKYSEYYFSQLAKFKKLCEEAIGDYDIKINIENTSGWSDIAKQGVELLLQSKVFGLTYDIGHSHSHKHVDEEIIFKHISKLHHCHFHDAIGKENHLPLFTGEIDLKERYYLMDKYKCRCVVEVKDIPALTQSIENLRIFEKEKTINGI